MLNLIWILTLFHSSQAQTHYQPEFRVAEQTEKQNVFPREHVTHFRVQVFPHLGSYATPQGRDVVSQSVSVTSTGDCSERKTTLDENHEWLKGDVVRTQKLPASFRAGEGSVTYFECPESFVIHRAPSLKSIEYAGDFVVVTSKAQVKIINILEPDTYLKGVIPSEVSASWPDEVLKAQAVAARTYAWWTVTQTRNKSSDFDMDDTVAYQAYMGLSNQDDRSDSAADVTTHQVLTANGQLIKAYFSADSGGYTADAAEVFGAVSYCKAVRETYDQSIHSASAWTKIYTNEELAKELISAKLLKEKVSVKSISIREADRTGSGRARSLEVKGQDGVTYSIDGNSFRFATHIKSTLFEIAKTDHGFLFSGKGYGHGVGMAQIGALQYAKQFHWSYDQILNFYYSGVNLVHD